MTDWDTFLEDLKATGIMSEQIFSIQEIREKYIRDEIILSVMGQFKRGKSSLINAILGAELLPTGILPVTAVVTELRCSDKTGISVFFGNKTSKEIELSELDEYCSELKNSGNQKDVVKVCLETERFPFGKNVVLVDTPGVGSLNRKNTDAAMSYVSKSDIILFLLSVDSPISQTELSFLMETRTYASHFFFAVNKIDSISPTELDQFLGYCRKVIGEAVHGEIKIYPVSSKTGIGISELTEDIRRELALSGEFLLEGSIRKKRNIALEQVRAKIALSLEAASLSAAERADKQQKIEQIQEEMSHFGDELGVIAKFRTNKLVEEIRSELEKQALKEEQRAADECRKLMQQFSAYPLREFGQELNRALNAFLLERLQKLNETGLNLLKTGYASAVQLLNSKAAEAEMFASSVLKAEFGVDYPLSQNEFEVSELSDFLYQIDVRERPQLYHHLTDHLIRKKAAQTRLMNQSVERAQEDIHCNINNMIYNYRYKMQESLRSLCMVLGEQIQQLNRELNTILSCTKDRCTEADELQSKRETALRKLDAETVSLLQATKP